MSNVKKQGVALASMKAGFGKSTGYRILSRGGTKPVKKPRTSRCPDPLAGIFDAEVVPLLEWAPDIRPVTVFQKLMEEHPELSPGVRRTLERRVRAWKAENGPGKAVIFPQTEVPGRTGISDFTHMNALRVTIGGKPSDHMLYHFRLPWSGFGHADVVLGGESFAALSEYLQKGLAAVGGVPREHRTDSLPFVAEHIRNLQQCQTIGVSPPGAFIVLNLPICFQKVLRFKCRTNKDLLILEIIYLAVFPMDCEGLTQRDPE